MPHVATYATIADGGLTGASSFDISGDAVAPGEGRYDVIKPLGCGSGQSAEGPEAPRRDLDLP